MGLQVFKIILLGDSRVGKTTIRKRYFGEGFKGTYIATLGADFALKQLEGIDLAIWDLAGQHSFQQLHTSYFAGAHGAIVVFDVTSHQSLENLDFWIGRINEELDHIIPTVIVCNKMDLVDTAEEVISIEAINFTVNRLAHQYKVEFGYIETSAKTGVHIDLAFNLLSHKILYNFHNYMLTGKQKAISF